MSITPTSAAVRATAAALAVFATMVTLNAVVSIAEPQRGGWMAQEQTRHATASAMAHRPVQLAQAETSVHP